ncbi:hypothetical protein FB451DRAFT_1190883 [Mycena latifolia]|nr:hypothetical protein FB451DRAFT_1190883 [Mycena latifolia]
MCLKSLIVSQDGELDVCDPKNHIRDCLSSHHRDWAQKGGLCPRWSEFCFRNIDPTQIYYRQWLLSRFHRADLPLRLVSTPTLLALDTSSTPLPGLNQPRALFGELSDLIYGLPSHPRVLFVCICVRECWSKCATGSRGERRHKGELFLCFSHQDPSFRVSDLIRTLCCAGLRLPACVPGGASRCAGRDSSATPTPLDPAIGSYGVIHVTVAHPSPYTPRPAPRSGLGPFPRSYELTACRRMLLVSPTIAALPRLAPLSSRIMRMSLQAGATVGARPNGWSNVWTREMRGRVAWSVRIRAATRGSPASRSLRRGAPLIGRSHARTALPVEPVTRMCSHG